MRQEIVNEQDRVLQLLEAGKDSPTVQNRAIALVVEGFNANTAVRMARVEEEDEREIAWRVRAGLTRAQAAETVRQQRLENEAQAKEKGR